MKKVVYICDICGIEKREVNHWFRCRLSTASPNNEKVNRVYIYTWNDTENNSDSMDHICGLECMSRWINKKLSVVEPKSTTRQITVGTDTWSSVDPYP